jgi:tetratricopeptide (TPR) repeat protein
MIDDIDILIKKAYENLKNKDKDAAKSILKKVLSINPLSFDANHILGVILGSQGRHNEAKSFLKKATEIDQDNYFAQFNYAKSLVEIGDNEGAIFYNQNAVRIDPKNKQAWVNYGVNLKNLKFYIQSLDCFEKALTIDPNYLEALVSKSDVLILEKKYKEALLTLDKALLINSSNIDIELLAVIWINRGVAFLELNKFSEALFSFNQAIHVNPNDHEAWSNKGVLLKNLKKNKEAEYCYDQAIKLKPDYAEAYFNKAAEKLAIGDFENGWNLYKYRWRKKDFEKYRYPQFKELESIYNLKNKKILIWYEQGMGDTIQFSRYIPKLINLGAIITFEIQKDLVPFFRTQFDCEITEKIATNQHFEYQTPLLNLPGLFKTSLNTIFSNQAYLKVNEKVIDWKKKLNLEKNKLNIGVSISGNPNHKENHIRSIPLENIKSLFQKANFYIIQKELNFIDMEFLKKNSEINFMGEKIINFSDTAAIVENMDLIISIDTSLIHLAGAIGKRSFLLLPWVSEWRWLMDRDDSPWYETIKIIRQKSMGDWSYVINKIEDEISKIR